MYESARGSFHCSPYFALLEAERFPKGKIIIRALVFTEIVLRLSERAEAENGTAEVK